MGQRKLAVSRGTLRAAVKDIMPNETQQANLAYFQQELPRLLGDPLFRGKYVVIHDHGIRHTADTFENALKFAVETYPADEFVIQQVVSDDESINFVRIAV
jgi:hypothetical protein